MRAATSERSAAGPPQRVCVVGLGGLGCPATLGLAARGVRALTLVDPDVVDVTNLHRQPWHRASDVGRAKVDSAAEKLRRQFPALVVDARVGRVSAADVLGLFAEHDLVIDATDGVHTKFLLSDASVSSGTPVVYGGVLRFEGLAMRIEPGGPCLRCLFEHPPTEVPTCAQAGVLGSMAGVIGGLQAELACTPNERAAEGWLHVVDGLAMVLRRVRVRRRADCGACAPGAKPVLSTPEELACPTNASTSPVRSAP
jgi:molybdopterin/thiamine biosynthesis adenylyltransferase